jgi:RNA polymerase sigma-70 factor (ECF subfamily)
VDLYHGPLYRFAVTLTRKETDACDLTQETFRVWATKGHQLRDASRVKSWLFTTLHRLFLETQRRQTRFPHLGLEEAAGELPNLDPALTARLDSADVLELLGKVDAQFRAPVALFYLEDHPYAAIAEILDIPLGTVKSRIARGLAQLRQIVLNPAEPGDQPTEERP